MCIAELFTDKFGRKPLETYNVAKEFVKHAKTRDNKLRDKLRAAGHDVPKDTSEESDVENMDISSPLSLATETGTHPTSLPTTQPAMISSPPTPTATVTVNSSVAPTQNSAAGVATQVCGPDGIVVVNEGGLVPPVPPLPNIRDVSTLQQDV